GIAVRQGLRFLRAALPRILATPHDVLSPRMVHVIEDLAGDWNSSTSVHEIAQTPPPLAIGQLRESREEHFRLEKELLALANSEERLHGVHAPEHKQSAAWKIAPVKRDCPPPNSPHSGLPLGAS